MPDYGYAILSALLWASSVPIINMGLAGIPENKNHQWIAAGLFLAMATGTIALLPLVLMLNEQVVVNTNLVLAGVLTFPLATGVYYLAGDAFSGRTEFASQFSKVKPLFSFVLAVVVLREGISNATVISVTLVGMGTLLLLFGAGTRVLNRTGVLLGLLTALFWGLGELFMKLGIQGNSPLAANWVALASGTLIFSLLGIPSLLKVAATSASIIRLWPFCIHGIVSFCAAYSLFFYSLDQIGLAKSVLINAFWPILSVLITTLIRVSRRQPPGVPRILLVAALILLAGSLAQTVSEL